MSSITIRRLAPELKDRLRIRAAERGHSMEAEARDILQEVLDGAPSTGAELVARIRARFEPLGGAEIELPPRGPGRDPPKFA